MNAVATQHQFRIATIEVKKRVREQKLRMLLGNALEDFKDLFKQGDPNISIGVFDDADRLYLDMLLAEAGLTVQTLDHQDPYVNQSPEEHVGSLVRNIKEEVRALDQFDAGIERAREFTARYRQTIYQMFSTHLVSLVDPWHPVAVICSEENVDFVQNCLGYYHGPQSKVDRFLDTPEGFVWVISPGVPRSTDKQV